MATIDMCINRREISVQPQNRIKLFTKQADGSMAVVFASGDFKLGFTHLLTVIAPPRLHE